MHGTEQPLGDAPAMRPILRTSDTAGASPRDDPPLAAQGPTILSKRDFNGAAVAGHGTGRIMWVIAKEELRLTRGLHALTAIAYGAPMAGVLLTCIGIVGSFRGIVGNAEYYLFSTAHYVSEAIIPTAAGLLIGIYAMLAQRYLRTRVESLVHEMLWYRAEQ